ncbi:MAG TPA: hypothetical protein IAA64_12170 [Candidatus Ornithocaccomicrobium faecavium]|uniref:Alpha-galactosidase NEW3 domain-containing protein n=1 Tax=Candidatus Ornithocaccomicrobium faecavium TaxID=2840890 RepID=A0A9D1P932_9FIRM|nr:hypothetical protein [Candidatus Ornithocaccomicrobium faecavium]
MKHKSIRTLSRMAALALALTLLASCAMAESLDTAPAAEPYIELSTQYPALTVKAGDSLTFDLDLDNYSGVSQDITLSVAEIPEGWEGTFSAGSNQVSVVHVKNQATNSEVSFAVDVPLETADGEYIIRLAAQGEDFADEMEIALTVSAEEIGESSFTAEYPSQEGDATTDFTFSATLINNTLSTQNYSFTSNAPSGWQVSFQPSGESTSVAALDVEARTTQAMDISVTPPENVEAGTYEIPVTATSVNESMPITLSVTITGSYGLTLSTPSGRLSLDAYANQESAVQLSLTNTGNSDLTNVNITSSAPTGWTVRFANETIDIIEAGATVETTMYITPGEDAMSGDYATTITARNSDANDSVDFRITVKTETIWGLTGIGVIVVLAVVIGIVMRKYGRR